MHTFQQSSNAEDDDEDEYVRRSALKNKWWKSKGLKAAPPAKTGRSSQDI